MKRSSPDDGVCPSKVLVTRLSKAVYKAFDAEREHENANRNRQGQEA